MAPEVDRGCQTAQSTCASRRGIPPRQPAHSSTVVFSFERCGPGGKHASIITNLSIVLVPSGRHETMSISGNQKQAPQGPLEPHTATILTFPVSCRHTVRSVSQEAYKTLWAIQPDRAERWLQVRNMDLMYGVGRPLSTITKEVIAVAVEDMKKVGMKGNVIIQHLETFACLMFWAGDHGFVRWSEPSEHDVTRPP